MFVRLRGCLVLVFLKVPKVGLGISGRQDFGTLWARILLGFPCFGCCLVVVFLKGSQVGLGTPGRQDFGMFRMLLGSCLFKGFEGRVRHTWASGLWHALGSKPAGVSLFRMRGQRRLWFSCVAFILPFLEAAWY